MVFKSAMPNLYRSYSLTCGKMSVFLANHAPCYLTIRRFAIAQPINPTILNVRSAMGYPSLTFNSPKIIEESKSKMEQHSHINIRNPHFILWECSERISVFLQVQLS